MRWRLVIIIQIAPALDALKFLSGMGITPFSVGRKEAQTPELPANHNDVFAHRRQAAIRFVSFVRNVFHIRNLQGS